MLGFVTPPVSSVEETASDLMVKCSPHLAGHVIPAAVTPLTTSGRTVCRKTCEGLMSGVLTRRPLPEPSLPNRPNTSQMSVFAVPAPDQVQSADDGLALLRGSLPRPLSGVPTAGAEGVAGGEDCDPDQGDGKRARCVPPRRERHQRC